MKTETGTHKRARARRGGLQAPGGATHANGNAAKNEVPEALVENFASLGHFTPAEAQAAFSPAFMDEARCRQWFIGRLHGNNPVCPCCGLQLLGATFKSFWTGRRCHCPRCGRGFTARTGTFLANAELTYSQVFLMAALIPIGLTPATIAAFVGVSADTVRIWIKRFKSLDY